MNFKTLQPDKSISLFVKNILVFEELSGTKETTLPFFADGYPGLMFQETENGLVVQPHNKKMPLLFIYGQTINPIELQIKGKYKLIVFQLYPFILKSFFNISAIDINDNCYNIQQLESGNDIIKKLIKDTDTEKRIDLMTDFLFTIFKAKQTNLDLTIKQSIQLILDTKGQLSIKDVCAKIHLTERTFERRFANETGVSPKQFSKIIQFQQSLEQLTLKEFTKLTDVVYNNGFADQSHFTRVFKAFTGKTPKKFLSK